MSPVHQEPDRPRRIGIRKGRSSSKLSPLVLIKIPEDIEDLDQMRTMLARFKYISSVDSFLSASGFPIHQEDEPSIKWKDALVSNTEDSKTSLNEDNNGGKYEYSDDTEDLTDFMGNLLILSRPIDQPPRPATQIKQAAESADPIEDPNASPAPKSSEKVRASENQVANAKSLNKEEIDSVFEVNNVFGGISFVGPIAACSQIFEPPKELSSLIWVCDDSTLQIQSFESSTQLSMFKEGAVGMDLDLTIKGVTLGAGMESKDKYEHSAGEGFHWVAGVYRYPRAVIRLPVASMRPTMKFKNELAAAFSETDIPDLKKRRIADFFSQYGQAIASEVYLGGHLHTTLLEKKSEESTEHSANKTIRAGLSFPFGLGVSGKYSSEKGSSTHQQMKSSDLVIEAVGGDTILASNSLELWSLSVTPHTNWRITQRSGVKLLIDIGSLFNQKRKDEVVALFDLNPKQGEGGGKNKGEPAAVNTTGGSVQPAGAGEADVQPKETGEVSAQPTEVA